MSGYKLFSDPIIDDRVNDELPSPYLETLKARSLRYKTAYDLWMLGYEATPKPLLVLLQAKLNFYNEVLSANPGDSKATAELATINSIINNNEYAVEGTDDYVYAISRKQRISEFNTNFPDSNEINLRQIEENNLLSQLQ